jgi:hypothetical protein
MSETPDKIKRRARWPWAYAGFVLAVALLRSLSELQHYLARGGEHGWEPFLWELSSAALTGPLSVLVYHWHVAGIGAPLQRQLRRHAGGALLYMLAHVGGMFGIRFAVYALMQVGYEPGTVWSVLGYEAGKDFIGYTLTVAICHGLFHMLQGERLRAELAEARLARLTEQVQPHFLFNTLNLISSVMYEDVKKADRLLCRLADLLRSALTAQQQGWHTLQQELALIEPYLELMQARFGERLQVQWQIDPAAQAWSVPALLLLNPVENAIKHDVALSRGVVSVRVEAGLIDAGRHLRVRVHNSGVTTERLEREGGLGLANLRQRLLAAYGAGAAMQMGPASDGGTALELVLPARGAA